MIIGNLIQTEAFQEELSKLSREDRNRVYDAIYKLQRDSRSPGLQVKRMQRVDLWEVRASQDLRIIAKLERGDLFCYAVGHHDAALTRALRLQEMQSSERDILRERASAFSPEWLEAEQTPINRSGPLAIKDDDELLTHYCIPSNWIAAVRSLRSVDQLYSCGLDEAIPEEAFFRLQELFEDPSPISTGAQPVYVVPTEAIARAFSQGEIEQLELNLPPSSWSIVRSARRTPAYVKGGPGSGKTLVALYRALHVIEEPSLGLGGFPRVLYITYTRQLRDDAREKIRRLRGSVPRSLTIETYDKIAQNLAGSPPRTLYDSDVLRSTVASEIRDKGLNPAFVLEEISEVIEGRDVTSFEQYAALKRRGRGERLNGSQRQAIWEIYQRFTQNLASKGFRSAGAMRQAAALAAESLSDENRYDLVIVDEVQDLPPTVLAMTVSLAKGTGSSRAVMLVGDAGQSIYQRGFKWADVGLRIGGGNVFTLTQSERSTEEILAFGRALIGSLAEPEMLAASKRSQRPRILEGFRSADHRRGWLADDISQRIKSGLGADRIAVVARGRGELAAMRRELEEREVATVEQGAVRFYESGTVKLITAHSSKT